MKLVLLKHFSFDDESAIAEWARRKGHSVAMIDPSVEGTLPDIDSFDLLVILGGPMSVYDESGNPWLVREKRFIRNAAIAGKSVLGICLGGQLLAEVLGGRVYRSSRKEIGFHPVRRTHERHPLLEGLPEEFHSYQWHGDAFELPPGAVPLATSEACANQAFAYGPYVLGVQFHLETTPACIGEMLTRWSDELTDAPYVQSADAIREQLGRTADSHAMLRGILDNFERSMR
ncbi:type 1 glutamine amidotransferase [Cohnella xylanilytica]|uniref:Type 1 glutamine amidotransferase n=1 Tax=Cohnella xylanilytica TaxID=557555 RepID=A0A841TTC8_9BACL|nr:type 1 glutamine amidotransferase [Cohnella xylanilytica]MBB6691546.1 type 1 glutamine amidotransferase [Cohnella xylanilytica]